MGNDALVLWLSPELALAYFVAVIVGMMGLMQALSVRWQRPEFRWLPRRVAEPVGLLLVVGALAWFYLRYYQLIFVPGPAGLELIVLFASGSAVAVWLSRLLHALLGGRESTTPPPRHVRVGKRAKREPS